MSWLLATALLAHALLVAASQPELSIPQGHIKGFYQETFGGRVVSSFLGVPYAHPPERFQAAQPPKPWKETWNATYVHSDCMMFSQNTYRYKPEFSVYGVEDCLYLDIHTPQIGTDKLMDVIVNIHGGAFMFVYGGHHGPKYLLDRHDIIIVHVNYRLGPLGFLSTGDDVVPGNNGLKDQSMALKWVKENIIHFGGNPDSITITGLSAGGASVHYHYLSPMSKGLFARGVSVSGVALVPWAQTEKARERAQFIARNLGCPTEPSQAMVDCLRARPAGAIVSQTKHLLKWFFNPFTLFGPVVEPEGEGRFLTESPYSIIKSGKAQDLPWVTTFTKDEGLYPAAEFSGNQTAWKELNDHWDDIAPYLMDYVSTLPKSKHKEVNAAVKKHYMKGKSFQEDITTATALMSDRFFTAYIVKASKLQASINKSPVYTYKFSYRGKHSASEKLAGGDETDYGVSHGDDMGYIFERDDANPVETDNDRRMIRQLSDLYSIFASTGVPKYNGASWPTVNSQKGVYSYLEILEPYSSRVLAEQDVGEEKFWSSLPLKENDKLDLYSKDEL